MSAVSTPAARGGTTTYTDLTHAACRAVARGLLIRLTIDDGRPRPAHQAAGQDQAAVATAAPQDVAALRDLAAALAHLGTTLTTPLAQATTRHGGSGTGRRADARLITSLRGVAQARSWDEAHPRGGPAQDLDRAAVLVRAAADLWLTHRCADGRPRSPEASRMHHPATLGAAQREWRALVALTADVANALVASATAAGLAAEALSALRGFPRPTSPRSAARAGNDLMNVAVARPGISRGQPPLGELAERIDRIRRLLWSYAQSGDAPATVHANVALIAVAVHRSTARAHIAAATHAGGTQRRRHAAAADRARENQALWETVADRVRFLRTPHSPRHPIQVERLDIERLLNKAASPEHEPEPEAVAWELSRIGASLPQLAGFSAEAIRVDHDRGQLLLQGRAVPTEVLPRRPDLLRARLSDEAVRVPTVSFSRVESAYRAIAGPVPSGSAPPARPPAA